MKKQDHTLSGAMLGMAAGAAVGAAGLYLAGRNEWEMKKLAKKVAHGAENAVQGIETVLDTLTMR